MFPVSLYVMNKIYRTIWNHVRQCVMVVNELEFVKIIYETSVLDRRRKAGNPSESTSLARFDGLKFCGVFIVIC